jgi:hypothetical protein
VTPPRSIEEQFEPEVAARLRDFQRRLEAVRTTGEASDYFIFEALSCLDRGLLLAALQLITATVELRAREILIQLIITELPDRKGPANWIEISLEEGRDYLFGGILAALETRGAIGPDERQQLKDIYRDIRIPLHHGIVRRYSRSHDESDESDSEWILEAFWGDSQVHLTTSETEMESIIEMHGANDLDHAISALELLTRKFRKASSIWTKKK